MADGNIPFWAGKDVTLECFFDEKQLKVDHVDVDVKIRGEKAEDQIGGEDRSRTQFITDGYDITINAMQQKTALIDMLIAHQGILDARTLPKESAVGFIIRMQDGTQGGYEVRGVTIDDWTWNIQPGRKERNKMSIPLRAQYFDKIPVG